MQTIQSLEHYRDLLKKSPALLSYFSTEQCQVCKVLKPKVTELISENFPEMETAWIDIGRSPVVAGQNQIFTAPTILVYFNGKEYLRKSRNISITELGDEISRVYDLMFKT